LGAFPFLRINERAGWRESSDKPPRSGTGIAGTGSITGMHPDIRPLFSPPYTPEYNGAIEAGNGTLLAAHGHRVGAAKAAAVELAARLADMSGRAIGLRYGIGAAAVGAIHQRLQDRPDVLQLVESLAKKLCKTRTKLKL
jgi:hypothetical protein